MGFQIKDKEGNAISINLLDKEAAEFWNKNLEPKWYANPSPEGTSAMKQMTNWFDTIGYAIHSPLTNFASGWDNVRHTMWTKLIGWHYKKPESEQIEGVIGTNEYLKPYFRLITFWEAKGYTPHKTED